MLFPFRSGLIAGTAAIVIGCGFAASPVLAGYVVTLQQVGSNVVATGNGAIDLTGLRSFATGSNRPEILPSGGDIVTGSAGFATPYGNGTISTIIGPTNFGSGNSTFANNGIGDLAGIYSYGYIFVPQGYVSDSPLSDSATYNSATFASLGITPGTYEWIWGILPDQNFTVEAVPEPALGPLLATGALLLCGSQLRQLRRSN